MRIWWNFVSIKWIKDDGYVNLALRLRQLKLSSQHIAQAHHPLFSETAALQALKRKKRYEKQLAQIDGTLSTIEFQREALENANTNTEVIKNMGFAAKAMKAAHDNMCVFNPLTYLLKFYKLYGVVF